MPFAPQGCIYGICWSKQLNFDLLEDFMPLVVCTCVMERSFMGLFQEFTDFPPEDIVSNNQICDE